MCIICYYEARNIIEKITETGSQFSKVLVEAILLLPEMFHTSDTMDEYINEY